MLEELLPLLVLAASLLIWWLRKTFTFWKDKGIVHLGFWEYMRFCYDIYTKPLNEVEISYYEKYGRVYGSYQGTDPTLVVGDPDILREIMVSQFKNFSDRSEAQRVGSELWRKSILNLSGDEWSKTRRIFLPALNPIRLRKIALKVKATAEKAVSKVMEAVTQETPLNISELAEHSSLCSTIALNYSVDLENADKDHPLLKSLDAISITLAGWKLVMLFMMPKIYRLLQPDYPKEAESNLFKTFVSHLMEERKSKNKVSKEDDFLQVFMDAEYDWQNGTDGKGDNAEKQKMSLEAITAQGLIFFVAGVEGAASAVTHTAYLLATHPEYQDKVTAEVDKAISEGGLTYDALQEMPYLEASIKEAMRLATPDSVIMRLCTEETTVAGIHFKPGMCVGIPLAAIHRDPEYFPEPDKFNPERFLPVNKESVKPFTYIPFGAGPRTCVGKRLGVVQAKTTLACLLSRVRLEPCSETMPALKYKPCQLLPVIDGPVILRAVPRVSTLPKNETYAP
ncbi:cytochrome P450 3A13-like isoform X2 [Haemaphysalis longicornis]